MATATARRPAKAAQRRTPGRQLRSRGGKIIYFFGKSRCDGKGDMKALLGGKGANLAAMTRIGLPVPPGSRSPPRSAPTTTRTASGFRRTRPASWPRPWPGWRRRRARNSAIRRTRCSSPSAPGSRDSMPGMMDTILNLGLNDATTEGLASGDQQRPLCLGLVSPLRADVRRRGDGRAKAARERARAVRRGDGRAEARSRRRRTTPI